MDTIWSYVNYIALNTGFQLGLLFIGLSFYYYFVVRNRLSLYFIGATVIQFCIHIFSFFMGQYIYYYYGKLPTKNLVYVLAQFIDGILYILIAYLFYKLYKELIQKLEAQTKSA